MAVVGRRFAAGLVLALVACGSSSSSAPSSSGGDASAPSLPVLPRDPDAGTTVPPEPPKACPAEGRRCVPSAPAGWAGPMLVSDRAGAPPDCPASMALKLLDAHRGPPQGPHTCSGCVCGGVTGLGCVATATFYENAGCGGSIVERAFVAGVCNTVPNDYDTYRIRTEPTGGSCAPSGGAVTKDPITWPGEIRGCAAPTLLASGCGQSEVCAPDPPAEFRPRHCIANVGRIDCPAPWTTKVEGEGGVTDDRGCSTCTCGAPAGASCTGQMRHFDDGSACSGSPQTNINMPVTTCANTADNSGMMLLSLTPAGGACSVSGGGTPTGALTPVDPVTVCCLP